MLVFTSCGPDVIFSVPKQLETDITFSQQASEVVDTPPDSILGHAISGEEQTEIVTVGESIRSLRQLMHRANWVEICQIGIPYSDWNAAVPAVWDGPGPKIAFNLLPRFPPAYGRNSMGTSWIVSPDDPAKFVTASQVRTPLASFVVNCFAGHRGSVVHHVNVIANGCDAIDTVAASRLSRDWIIAGDKAIRNGMGGQFAIGAYNNTSAFSGLSTLASSPVEYHDNAQAGVSVTNQRTQSAMSVSMPYYSKWKFRPAWEFARDVYPSDGTDNEYESLRLSCTFRKPDAGSSTGSWPLFEHYFAVGPDFNVVFFICTPKTYQKTVPIVFNAATWQPPV